MIRRTAVLFGWAAATLIAPLGVAAMARAGELEVAPTTIQLSARTHAGLLTLSNRGPVAATVQVEAYDWSQGEAGEALTPSAGLIASPPMVTLAPGQRQIVRLLDTGGAPAQERAFRLLVSELPGPSAEPQGQTVRMLLQFSLPVFEAGSAAPAAGRLAWDAKLDGGRVVLTARNLGGGHVRLAGSTLAAADGQAIAASLPALAYVLGGASRRWTLAAGTLSAGQRVWVRRREADDGPMVETAVDIHP